MPIKRNAMLIKRNAMPMEAERYADEKGPHLAGLGGTQLRQSATLSRWLEPQGKLRLALGAVLDLVGGDDFQPL